ncbi:MAG TPA: UDP-N-acetylmuramoyl-L-alanyl-D-glutamate--2,6-diaminopimelate ligase [Anaerolineales bacterium]|nr:UDP-N-acetylmuramoyl-L-alanyl-D-glutamate--2,6-diaminopimelate ligase [Anaerolineales bacterium]
MNTPVRLRDLLNEFPFPYQLLGDDALVSGVVFDSRQVQAGSLFVAASGEFADGHRFIPDAIQRGAAAVVGSQDLPGLAVPYVRVPDGRQALPHLAAAFYGYPARKLTMLGVTGTDGKTTTVNLVYHIMQAAGLKVGMISTVNAVIGQQVLDTGFHVTTPDAPDVQRYLAQMVEAGLTHAVLETTSHGWAQYRVDACEFDVGVVTNITHEHLNYHGTYEAYRAAKGRLFTSLAETHPKPQGNPRLAVLNRDDSSYGYLSDTTGVPQVTYGFDPLADLRPEQVEHQPGSLSFTVCGLGLRLPLRCMLAGEFNVSNCLAAVGATVVALEIDPQAAARGIAALPGVPGRMERLDLGQDFTAIVDFAHTPNALKRALEAARKMVGAGRLIAVFGSAGARDQLKRILMAEVSAELADMTILTAEDPRTESLADILAAMSAGAESRGGVEGQTFWRIPDRGEAIRFAVSRARPGDIVIACGKGHEQSMCFGTTEYAWDDRTAMRAALSERLGIDGPGMPYLPTQEE